MKIKKISLKLLWIFGLTIFLFGCNSSEKEKQWVVIKQSDSIPNYLSFVEKFHNSHYADSALIIVEEKIFLNSYKSITRNGTFINYEEFINKYPEIKDIIDAESKLNLLKKKADSLEVNGKLISVDSIPYSYASITLSPLGDDGKALVFFDEGHIQNPRVTTDSQGDFNMVFHRSFLGNMSEFTLQISKGMKQGYIETVEGVPVIFKIDHNTRVMHIGDIMVK